MTRALRREALAWYLVGLLGLIGPACSQTQHYPEVLHVCAQHCSTAKWEVDHYVLVAGGAGGGEKVVATVESFTHDSVILHTASYVQGHLKFSSTIRGQIAPEGNHLINGFVGSNPVKMTWGSALNSIPGEDAAPAAQQPNALAALLLLGSMSGSDTNNENPKMKMNRLEAEMLAARDACNRDDPHGFGRGENCAREAHLRDEFDQARDDYLDAAKQLCDAQTALTKECKAGNKQSCQKLDQLKADGKLSICF
jgi:hypothetical protein